MILALRSAVRFVLTASVATLLSAPESRGDHGLGELWTQTQPSQAAYNFSSLASHDGVCVATRFSPEGHSEETIAISGNGTDWTVVHTELEVHLTDVAAGPPGYVAVGQKGRLLFSPHGYSWTQIAGVTGSDLHSVVWSGGAFVAGGEDGVLVRSGDGIAWTAAAAPGMDDVNDVFCTEDALIVLADGGQAFRSLDHGILWSSVDSGFPDNLWRGWNAPGGALVLIHSGLLFWHDDGSWTELDDFGYGAIYDIGCRGDHLVAVTGRGELFVSKGGTKWREVAEGLLASGWSGGQGYVTEWGDGWLLCGQRGQVLEFVPAVMWTDGDYNGSHVDSVHAITHAHGRFYAVGHYGHVNTSADGFTWSSIFELSSSYMWRSLVSWEGELVIVGRKGRVMTIDDALGWDLHFLGNEAIDLHCVTASEERLVAVGKLGAIMHSEDGAEWTATDSTTDEDLLAVEYHAGRFIAAGKGGVVLRSLDGINWFEVNAGIGIDLLRLKSTSRGLIAAGRGGALYLSQSGDSWTALDSGVSVDLHAVVETGQGIMALGANESVVVSSDAVEWTELPRSAISGENDFFDAVAVDGMLIAVGGRGIFEDAVNLSFSIGTLKASEFPYSAAMRAAPMANLSAVGVRDGGFIAVGTQGTIRHSADGFDWDEPDSVTSWWLKDILTVGDRTVIVGTGGLLTSADGRDWRIARFDPYTGGSLTWKTPIVSLARLAWGNGTWVACGPAGAVCLSADGESWHVAEDSAGVISGQPHQDVAWGGGRFVICGGNGTLLSSTDGETWATMDSGTDEDLQHVVWTGTEFIVGPYLVGPAWSDRAVLKSPDGVTWTSHDEAPLVISTRLVAEGGLTYLLGDREQILSSSDGLSWRYHSHGASLGTLFDVEDFSYTDLARSNGVWVGVGSDGLISVSTDTDQWQFRSGGYVHDITDLHHVGDRFIAFGQGSAHLVSSRDGIEWVRHRRGDHPYEPLYDLASNGSRSVIVGDTVLVSDDLWSWTEVDEAPAASLREVVWDGSRFVAGGEHGVTMSSPDGIVWTPGAGLSRTVVAMATSGTATVALTSQAVFVSTDASTWTEIDDSWRPDTDSQLIWDGSRFISCEGGHFVMISDDGWTWTSHYVALPVDDITAVDGWLFGSSTHPEAINKNTIVHSLDGTDWERLDGAVPPVAAMTASRHQLMLAGRDGEVLISQAVESAPFYHDLLGLGISPADDLAADADLNGDGVSNMLARYFGLPVDGVMPPGAMAVLPAIVTLPGTTDRQLCFTLPAEVPAYLDLSIEKSNDLTAWLEVARSTPDGQWSGAAQVAETVLEDGSRRITLAVIPDGGGAFWRLLVSATRSAPHSPQPALRSRKAK